MDMFIDGKFIHSNVQVSVSIARFDFLLIYILICVLKWMKYIQQRPSLKKMLCAVSTSDMHQVWKPSLLQSFHGGNYLLSHLLKLLFITSSNLSLHNNFYMNIVTKSITLSKTEFLIFLSLFPEYLKNYFR